MQDANDSQPPAGKPAPSVLDALSGSSTALPLGTRMAEFEITRVIGEGGFGIVYLAYDHTLARQVAIKEYMPNQLAARTRDLSVSVRSERHTETFAAGLRSFVNEARLLAQFDHASLVRVYQFWEANGTAYMVMPYVEGQTLKATLARMSAPPDEAWLRGLMDHLLDALEQMHDADCYHRDIAPDNILILGDGRPLLLDFGAARRVIGDMTKGPTVILKPGYAPVEQYGELPNMRQGPWTDLYALASVVHYAIMGTTPPQAVGRYLADKYEPLTLAAAGRYSVPFLQALDRALRVEPQERPQSVAQMRALLQGDAVQAGVAQRRMAAPDELAALQQAGAAASALSGAAGLRGGVPAGGRAAASDAARAARGPRPLPEVGAPSRAAWVMPALVGATLVAGVAALWYSIHGVSTLRYETQAVERAPIPLPTPASASGAGQGAVPGAIQPGPAALAVPAAAPVSVPPLPPKRCGELIQRQSLGSALNNEEKAFVERECSR